MSLAARSYRSVGSQGSWPCVSPVPFGRMGKSPRSGVRIGDAERDEAVALLWKHYEAGRLGPAEHEKRCARAKVAHRRGEIEVLFADLPAPHPDLSAAVPPAAAATTPVAAPEADTAGERLTLSDVLDGPPATCVILAIFGLADMVKRRQGAESRSSDQRYRA
jgi:hypothetical protein